MGRIRSEEFQSIRPTQGPEACQVDPECRLPRRATWDRISYREIYG